jgi:hypothetical protein
MGGFERLGRRVGVLTGSLAVATAGTIGWLSAPAAATTVSTEAQLRTAFTNASETQVDLANDITLTDCISNFGEITRNSNTALTLDGHGFTVTQTCPIGGVFGQSGGAATTFQNITITGGNQDNPTFSCFGGAIRASAPVTVLNSNIVGNSAGCAGGGISVGSSLVVRNSTISGNSTDGEGGGIFQSAGPPSTFELTNSTVTGNSVGEDFEGGGVRFFGAATVVYSTVVENTANTVANLSGYTGGPASLTIFGTVAALPLGGGDNCGGFGTPTTSFNWDDDGTCGFTGTGDNSNAGNPALGSLGPNGGPTQTREPSSGSPLIDDIPTGSCQEDGASGITEDQRFLPRPAQSGCDIGAVEVQPTPPPGPQPGPGPGEEGAGAGAGAGAAAPAGAVTAVVRFTG